MLTRIITLVFKRRHYWRSISFDDVAELYVSRLIMVFAVNIIGIFAALYLYKLGYSLLFITLLFAGMYLIRIPLSLPIAKYAAYFGPKHGILTANILRIPSLIAFLLVPEYGAPAIFVFGILQATAAAMYDMCYMISFSKVKHALHAGKEIGTMAIIERVAKVASPLVGGVIATLYGPDVLIVVASVLLLLAALPLFHTVEPTPTKMKLSFSGFPWKMARPTLIAQSVVGVDFVTSGMAWTLFISAFIFSGLGESIYSAVGALASMGVLASVVASWVFGKLIDRRKGHILLASGTVAMSIIHLFRPFISTAPGVVAVNLANESTTAAYAMSLTRATFDAADNSGSRIVYMMYIEIMLAFGATLACLLLALGIWALGDRSGLMLLFFIASAYQLLLLVSTRQAK